MIHLTYAAAYAIVLIAALLGGTLTYYGPGWCARWDTVRDRGRVGDADDPQGEYREAKS